MAAAVRVSEKAGASLECWERGLRGDREEASGPCAAPCLQAPSGKHPRSSDSPQEPEHPLSPPRAPCRVWAATRRACARCGRKPGPRPRAAGAARPGPRRPRDRTCDNRTGGAQHMAEFTVQCAVRPDLRVLPRSAALGHCCKGVWRKHAWRERAADLCSRRPQGLTLCRGPAPCREAAAAAAAGTAPARTAAPPRPLLTAPPPQSPGSPTSRLRGATKCTPFAFRHSACGSRADPDAPSPQAAPHVLSRQRAGAARPRHAPTHPKSAPGP